MEGRGEGQQATAGGEEATAVLSDAEPFEAVVEGDEPGPLAVLGDPYAGRERVLESAADRLDATHVRLQPDDGAARIREALGNGPAVIEDCQHLYRRVIDGFEPLEEALDLLSTAEATVVTGWNRYAWTYLATVRNVEPVFPAVAEVGPIEAESLAELLLARYDSIPTFELDDFDGDDLVSFRRHTVELAGRTLSIPIPEIHASPDRATVEPRDVVFERLAAAADGNVGVASALWERYRGDAVRPSDIAVPESDLSLDREEAFALRALLAKERLRRDELDALVDAPERVLARLRRGELATVDGDEVWLNPTAVPAAVEYTDRERIP